MALLINRLLGRQRFGKSILILLLSLNALCAKEEISAEYKVKALYLFHFIQFIEWPNETFSDPKAPIEVGILGNDPFGGVFEGIVKDETVSGRNIVIKRSKKIDQLGKCQILFIPRTEWPVRLDKLHTHPILTVGESDGFIQAGGIINFLLVEKNVRFEINQDEARKSGLKLSSKLLRVAVPRLNK